MLEVALPLENGVVIFSYMRLDREFGTHPNCSFRSYYHIAIEYPLLNYVHTSLSQVLDYILACNFIRNAIYR